MKEVSTQPKLFGDDGSYALESSATIPVRPEELVGQDGSQHLESSDRPLVPTPPTLPVEGQADDGFEHFESSAKPPVRLLALDWSHARDFATYDGTASRTLTFKEVLELAKSAERVAIERGAPGIYVFGLARLGKLYYVNTQDTASERIRLGLEKSDAVDAEVIYNLAAAGKCTLVTLDDFTVKLAFLFHQWRYAEKAQYALSNLARAIRRQWHIANANNGTLFQLDVQVQEWESRSEALRKEIEKVCPQPPEKILRVKGMSLWLWAGILVTADPRRFPTKAAYRKYLGYMNKEARASKTDNGKTYYNKSRAASTVYFKVVDQFIKHRTPYWRDLYDEKKAELAAREGYTHPHSGAINRVATKFACFVWDAVKEEGIIKQGEMLE